MESLYSADEAALEAFQHQMDAVADLHRENGRKYPSPESAVAWATESSDGKKAASQLEAAGETVDSIEHAVLIAVREQGEAARQKLIESHLGLAQRAVRHRINKGTPYDADELLFAANTALIAAADAYDPTFKSKKTGAPVHFQEFASFRIMNRLAGYSNKARSVAPVSFETLVVTADVHEPNQDDEAPPLTVHDVLSDWRATPVEEQVAQGVTHELERLIDLSPTPRSRDILYEYFGWYDHIPVSADDLAAEYGVSVGRIGSIIRHELRRLGGGAVVGALHEFRRNESRSGHTIHIGSQPSPSREWLAVVPRSTQVE